MWRLLVQRRHFILIEKVSGVGLMLNRGALQLGQRISLNSISCCEVVILRFKGSR